jgi:hypothetical protein
MKIPKIIFQSSVIKFPKYLTNMIQAKCNGWKYYHFNDEEVINYITENPLEEFKNSVEVYNSIEKGQHKIDFFRYYYLYINGGVFIDSDAILEKNIEEIVGNYSFFSVKSIMNNDSIFNGFIGCEPKHIIIYEALKHLYHLEKSVLKNDYFYVCKNLYNIIETHNNLLGSFFVNSKELIDIKIKIYNETVYKNNIASTVNDNNEILLLHYFDKSIIPSSIPIKNREIKPIKDTKIGITLNMPDEIQHLFSNGIRQNVIYLGELLTMIGYDCYFIIRENNYKQDILDKLLYSLSEES